MWSRSNWNLEVLVFEERGKLEYLEKNLLEQGREPKQTQPTYGPGTGSRTWATLMGGEHSHHCAIPAPPVLCIIYSTKRGH